MAIARALMQNPKMVLADEPIASLDPLNAKIVMDALRDINEREGITVITNLHTLDTARNYCERIVGMVERPRRLRRQALGADRRSGEGNLRDGQGRRLSIDETVTSTSINIAPERADHQSA